MKRSPAPLKTAREKNKGRTKATLPNKRIESNPIQSKEAQRQHSYYYYYVTHSKSQRKRKREEKAERK